MSVQKTIFGLAAALKVFVIEGWHTHIIDHVKQTVTITLKTKGLGHCETALKSP